MQNSSQPQIDDQPILRNRRLRLNLNAIVLADMLADMQIRRLFTDDQLERVTDLAKELLPKKDWG